MSVSCVFVEIAHVHHTILVVYSSLSLPQVVSHLSLVLELIPSPTRPELIVLQSHFDVANEFLQGGFASQMHQRLGLYLPTVEQTRVTDFRSHFYLLFRLWAFSHFLNWGLPRRVHGISFTVRQPFLSFLALPGVLAREIHLNVFLGEFIKSFWRWLRLHFGPAFILSLEESHVLRTLQFHWDVDFICLFESQQRASATGVGQFIRNYAFFIRNYAFLFQHRILS